jgi:hypothetical protein
VTELAEARARIFELEKSLRASEAQAEALASEAFAHETEARRLREGLEEALRQIEADRYIIARNVLRGVITGDTW